VKIGENLEKSAPSPTLAWLFEKRQAEPSRKIPIDIAGK
jgi:hypothetical protein